LLGRSTDRVRLVSGRRQKEFRNGGNWEARLKAIILGIRCSVGAGSSYPRLVAGRDTMQNRQNLPN
jgi:hypothetical protein